MYENIKNIRNKYFTIAIKELCYWLDDRGFDSGQEQKICLFSKTSRPDLEPTQRPIQWVLWVVLFPRVKQPGLEAYWSSPSSAKVKNESNYTRITHCLCMDSFTCFLPLASEEIIVIS
jgi:hypothetical protein